MSWLADNAGLIGSLSLAHLRQSLFPLVLGLMLAVPLGWIAHRYAPTRTVLLTAVSLLFVIPSLALFALLPPLLGISFLSEANLLIALTIYAVATLTRFVTDAFDAVDPLARSAATAVGYSGWQRSWRVDLPLAGPVVLAGLRVTAASTISLATVGILIGITNLGYLFTNGYQRQITISILAGVVAVVLIAFLVDRALLVAGRVLMPWTGGGSPAASAARNAPAASAARDAPAASTDRNGGAS